VLKHSEHSIDALIINLTPPAQQNLFFKCLMHLHSLKETAAFHYQVQEPAVGTTAVVDAASFSYRNSSLHMTGGVK
jgi:hypothetical protein